MKRCERTRGPERNLNCKYGDLSRSPYFRLNNVVPTIAHDPELSSRTQ